MKIQGQSYSLYDRVEVEYIPTVKPNECTRITQENKTCSGYILNIYTGKEKAIRISNLQPNLNHKPRDDEVRVLIPLEDIVEINLVLTPEECSKRLGRA